MKNKWNLCGCVKRNEEDKYLTSTKFGQKEEISKDQRSGRNFSWKGRTGNRKKGNDEFLDDSLVTKDNGVRCGGENKEPSPLFNNPPIFGKASCDYYYTLIRIKCWPLKIAFHHFGWVFLQIALIFPLF